MKFHLTMVDTCIGGTHEWGGNDQHSVKQLSASVFFISVKIHKYNQTSSDNMSLFQWLEFVLWDDVE